MQRGKKLEGKEEQIQAANKIGAIHRGRKARRKAGTAEAAEKCKPLRVAVWKAEKLKAKENG